MKNPPSEGEVRDILNKLQITVDALVRKKEAVWKENYAGKTLTEDQVIKAMASHPKLIERPSSLMETEPLSAARHR